MSGTKIAAFGCIGAWMEWEIDHIEMAVPISPEELRQKRNAILRHQSQMESAPFLGDDERLFWQRSKNVTAPLPTCTINLDWHPTKPLRHS